MTFQPRAGADLQEEWRKRGEENQRFLEKARADGRVKEEIRDEEGYGPFPGGDPRRFTPDPDCSTQEERDRWEQACRLVNSSGLVDYSAQCRLIGDGSVHTGRGFGLGTYTAKILYLIVTDEQGNISEWF